MDIAPSELKTGINSRLEAYAILTHHHLNEIDIGCCPKCCAPCMAIHYLLNDGILDLVVKNWDTYIDGSPVLQEENPFWWKHGMVDREWLNRTWKQCDLHDIPIVVPFGSGYTFRSEEDEPESFILGQPIEDIAWANSGEEQKD